jgi:TOTE conflict system primase-like protein
MGREVFMNIRHSVTSEMIGDFVRLFVNRRAYTVQSMRPHPISGRYYYFLPKASVRKGQLVLTAKVVRQHLSGEITIGLYSINPKTQRSKWVAIDADYEKALEDLLKLQWELQNDRIETALERSRRGGHLWIFAESPLLASVCRIYIHNLALRTGVPIKGSGVTEGIEIFPKQDSVDANAFGNSIRAPLGIHRAVRRRFFFYGADYTLEAQFAYLNRLRKLTEEQLKCLTTLKIPAAFARSSPLPIASPAQGRTGAEFRILEHVGPVRKTGRNYWTRCPSCALSGHDHSGDNLAIAIDDPRKYKCWASCSKEMIRAAVGCPVRGRTLIQARKTS